MHLQRPKKVWIKKNSSSVFDMHWYSLKIPSYNKQITNKPAVVEQKKKEKGQNICCAICIQSMEYLCNILRFLSKKHFFFLEKWCWTHEGIVSVNNLNGWPDWVCEQCVRSQAPASLKLLPLTKMDQDQFCHFLDEPTFLFSTPSVCLWSSSLCLQPWHLSKSALSPPPKPAGAVPHMSRFRNPVRKTAAWCWAWFILTVCSIINGCSVLQLSLTFLTRVCLSVYLSVRALASQHCCLDLFRLWTWPLQVAAVIWSSLEMWVCVCVWYILETFALHVCLSFVLNYSHSSQIKLSPFPCHVIMHVELDWSFFNFFLVSFWMHCPILWMATSPSCLLEQLHGIRSYVSFMVIFF